MKAEIHPDYNQVVFQDLASDFKILTRSTLSSVIKIDISSASHPFYTGKQNTNTTAGAIDKFNNRYGRK
ncbi:UNVERIFIED_CONTAM: hypothetical protein GTU68_022789 [Idotea baltica]|nr:hypothetical protein [Idotea baltica]